MIAAGLLQLQSSSRGPSVVLLLLLTVNPVEVASNIALLPNSLEKNQVSSSQVLGKHCQKGRNVVRLSCILDRYHDTGVRLLCNCAGI